MCLPNILSPVFMHVCFYFSLPLIFTLLLQLNIMIQRVREMENAA